MFSKSSCPYCYDAKAVFSKMGVQPKVIELNQVEDGSAMQGALAEISNQTTVPNIFINKKHVGGCDDLKYKTRAGTVQKLLDEAGIKYY